MKDRAPLGPESLTIEDQRHAAGYVVLYKYILHASNLSAQAKILYCFLLSYAYEKDHCFPGYQRLGGDLGWSENVVRKYMQELQRIRLVRVEHRGLGQSNRYRIARLESVRIRPAESEVGRPQDVRFNTSESEVQEEDGSKNQVLDMEPVDPTAGMTDLERRRYYAEQAR